jgi:hypothetical protein
MRLYFTNVQVSELISPTTFSRMNFWALVTIEHGGYSTHQSASIPHQSKSEETVPTCGSPVCPLYQVGWLTFMKLNIDL